MGNAGGDAGPQALQNAGCGAAVCATFYQFTRLRFDRGLVRRIAILKRWETCYVFDPVATWS